MNFFLTVPVALMWLSNIYVTNTGFHLAKNNLLTG